MEIFTDSIFPFLAILNPFALCLYLSAVMEDLETRAFLGVLFRACAISAVAFTIFAVAGETLINRFFGIRPDAIKAFGGIVFLMVGYNYVLKGYKAAEMLRGTLDELPSAIALPYMIGAGTIAKSIFSGIHGLWHNGAAN